ncbi:MAG: BBP7 family outer membrane beta-barrel protein [Aureliella sp.]
MRMLSGRMHWLTVGLALLVSAQGFATKRLHGQAPPAGMAGQMPYGMPPGMGGVRPAGGMMSPDRPTSMVFEGPPPMEVTYASACDNARGYDGNTPGGCNTCGGAACGGMGCGYGGGMGSGGVGSGLLGRMDARGCSSCGNALCGGRGCGQGSGLGGGCGVCGGAACGGAGCGGLCSRICGNGNGCLGSGALLGLLGPLAPYSEGGQGSQRWFDFYAGTMGLSRTSDFGGFATPDRNMTTGEFARSHLVSTNGISGTPVLSTSELDLSKMRYGLELIGAIQLGPGSSVEARYFGLNNWNVSKQAEIIPNTLPPTLYSSYSQFGTSPVGGFDDTDRSYIHKIGYSSELNNGEVNYRRRFASPFACGQGSWLAGVRYFDLDEQFSFNAIGSNNNTFTFDQLRYFNQDTQTRNELTGFQLGGDYWVNVAPGLQIGAESKGGIFGNHATVETQITSNSIPGAHERLSDGRTAYLGEFVLSAVYRMSYSWSLKTSYNLLYVDNVALAPENYNTRDMNNALGSGQAFTVNRYPFIDTDGEVCYQGWSIGGEYLW